MLLRGEYRVFQPILDGGKLAVGLSGPLWETFSNFRPLQVTWDGRFTLSFTTAGLITMLVFTAFYPQNIREDSQRTSGTAVTAA